MTRGVTRDAWLWIAAAIGPLAWFGDLVISFAVSPGPHRAPDAPALLAISGAAFVLAALGAVIAWRTPAAAPRPRMLAHAGLALAVLAMLLVVATALPTVMLRPGGEP